MDRNDIFTYGVTIVTTKIRYVNRSVSIPFYRLAQFKETLYSLGIL